MSKKYFKIEYSEDQVVRILRDKLKMRFSKPYPTDYRKPKDAEAMLENQLQLTFSLLKEKGIMEKHKKSAFISFCEKLRGDEKGYITSKEFP